MQNEVTGQRMILVLWFLLWLWLGGLARGVHHSAFERVEEFRYLGTTLTNQNSIQKEIKRRLNLGNACYHSVQNIFFQ